MPRRPDRWAPCPTGELQRLSARLTRQRQRRQLLRLAAAGGLLAAGGGALAVVLGLGRRPPELTCQEVARHLGAPAAPLGDSARRAVQAHLATCAACRAKYPAHVS